MGYRRILPRAYVLPRGHTMEPLWFSYGIWWESNSCLLEQLQSGSQSCADKKGSTEMLSCPFTSCLNRMPYLELWEDMCPLHRGPAPGPLIPSASTAAHVSSPNYWDVVLSTRRPGVVSTGSRGT